MFKVKFDPEQIAKVEAKFRKNIKEILEAPAVMREIGEFMVERVKYQARTESPLTEDESFPALKDATIKNREYLAKHNTPHATFEAKRSNVTITGAFLNSLTYLVKGAGLVEILYKGKHPGYRTGKGQTKSVNNSDLAKWLAEKGFKVMDKSIQTNQIVQRRIRAIALRYIRRGLSVRK